MRQMKKIHTRIACLAMCMAMFGAIRVTVMADSSKEYLVDQAGLLSDSETREIDRQLEALSDKYDMDFVIVTDEEWISSPMETADDFFDYNGYGRGADRSGSLLYINMETRDWWISTTGYGITAFTDKGISYIGDQIIDYLGDGEYVDAFTTYIRLCDEFVNQAKTGKPYDRGNMPKGPYPVFLYLLISIGTGLIAGGIYLFILHGQLKSVAPNESAADYVVPGSMHVTTAREFFLYHTIHRTKRVQENSGGGGSSTHRSSSGATHGGGGGKF